MNNSQDGQTKQVPAEAQDSAEQKQQRRQQSGGKAPESAGFDKKLDGPNRPSI
ncbi:hypothetical protein ACFOLF_25820 [Paenibacillus sepulcri]|uniref:hypothetical protein n=1 Tax=Paenibacillus sepulcri TaxID=359917 RepID=UPI001AE1AE00